MKFINVIREGDFVRLKTLSQLEKEFGKAQEGGAILPRGTLFRRKAFQQEKSQERG